MTLHPSQTWRGTSATRQIAAIFPESNGQEAAVKYHEGGVTRTVVLASFRKWVGVQGAVVEGSDGK